jgi:hypothetical protein
MRKSAVSVVFLTLCATGLMAGDLKTPYFQSTVPGSWVSYESTTEGVGSYQYTYKRLPDHGGQAVVEFSMKVLSGPGSGATNQQLFVMKPGFDLAKNAVNYMRAVETIVMQAGEHPAMLQPEAVVTAIRDGSCDYGSVFTFKGKEQSNGIACDAYTFEAPCGGPNPSTSVGEICLSDAVPFGIVYQKSSITGSDTGPSLQTLKDHGKGAKGTQMLLAALPAPKGGASKKAAADVPSIPLSEAYGKGMVEAHVKVVDGSNGSRLLVAFKNKTKKAMKVVVPAGFTSLEAGSPLGALEIAADSKKVISLEAGESASPVEVSQKARRGAVEGDFTLSVYEGEPLFAGSITMGSVGK